MVQYWAEEGVTWFKAYTQISRAELGAAIEEAHKHGVKVTAHLCSVGFREAVALGIDALEHGLLTNSEYWGGKEAGPMSAGRRPARSTARSTSTARTCSGRFAEMVAKKVAMTSTLDVFELSSPSRVPFDQRVLDALHPELRTADRERTTSAGRAATTACIAVFKKAMEFDRAFAKAGGLLGAGRIRAALSAIAGYGDQRNYELLDRSGVHARAGDASHDVERREDSGLRQMAWARSSRACRRTSFSSAATRRAAENIRNMEMVFRKGLGYDSAKLRESIKGLVGLR